MKGLTLPVIAFIAFLFPAIAQAATAAQFDAWKTGFPAAARTDSPKLQQVILGYQALVHRVTPATAKKVLLQLKDKLTREQLSADRVLHPPKPNPRITPAMQVEAAEVAAWLNGKFAPFLANAPQ